MTHLIGPYRRMLTAALQLAVALCLLAGLPASASSADSTFVLRPRFRPPYVVQRGLLRERTLQRPKVGLVLSGGGSRGAAQIGVLRALERHGIPVDFIAATSMGSIIGGLYAAGYTVAELESLAVHTNWDDVIVLGDETQRSQLFVDQKLADDRSFIAIRFEGFEPVLPPAVSSGQRLTDFLSARMLQALYYPFPDFDHLKIPFRAVATDLVSGERVVLRDGSLAEAMRASSTVPLLFSPIEKDSMRLVDGGLVSNVPADLARSAGCDIIIVVNSTSGLRTMDEMKSPWETADQIMGIMMKRVNERQMHDADIVITPDVGRHLSSSFHGLDTLIREGDETAERQMDDIVALYNHRSDSLTAVAGGPVLAAPVTVERGDASIPDSLWERWKTPHSVGPVPLYNLESFLGRIYASGDFDSVWAQVRTGPAGTSLAVYSHPNPTLRSVSFTGNTIVQDGELRTVFTPLLGRVLNHRATEDALEGLIRLYRKHGFSLAHIDSVKFDEHSGALSLMLDEGIITRIEVQGGIRTKDKFVLQEFPLRPGEVFQLDKARRGLSQLSGTTLFEYVYLEITSLTPEIVLTIRIKERPAQLVRLGLHADDERQLQGMIDIRDENWQGTGMQLGFQLAGGQRNGDATLDFSMKGLFNTYLNLGMSAFHRTWDTYLYGNGPKIHPNRWSRDQLGEYRDIRYGFSVSFGSLLERLGNATAEFIWQNIRLVNVQDLTGMDERYQLAIVRLATLVDTKDAYPFPTKGVGFRMSYEFSLEGLGSQVGYNALQAMYENYASWGRSLTFHPRFTIGFADNTMPLAQQFRLGGRDSFFGLREDDRRGRQLILVNMEVRYKLPIKLLFDTYLRARYDLGSISAVPEEIKFSSFLHGVGLELAFRTPVGPAVFGVGKAFYFTADLPNQPVQQGPFQAYVTIGYQL